MQHSDYVPLHLHTEYSLLDGAIRLDEMLDKAVKMKMPAVAVTDHGNLFCAMEFYLKAMKAGIKPIIGCEVYVALKSRLAKTKSDNEEGAFHLILLARDNNGYKNLVSLVTNAYLEGFYNKPRIDKELLEQYSGGLIGLSACMRGEVPYFLMHGQEDRARDAALAYKRILGAGNFYLELQENGLKEQEILNRKLYSLSKELHIGIVATNDCHYLNKEDAKAHEVLLCIQTGKTLSDPKHLRFEGNGFCFRSPEEMAFAFKDMPEAILNTRDIAERCNVVFDTGKTLLPKYETPDGSRPRELLEHIASEGLKKRLGAGVPSEYAARFKHEIEIINKMGYQSYFLIVWDFIKYAKGRGIPVGPGRGSAAGSLVAWALDITEIDPIKYGLLFERFLNPERISMPDIDVDFCKDRRPEVINYVSDKYGREHVAQIITFGTMAARASIRDVARAMDFPYLESDRLAKLVPEKLNIKLDEAIAQEPQLKESYEKNEKVRELLDIAMRLEGLCRHASTHAAGVVIAPEPLTDYMPLYKTPSEDALVTQFDMGSVEKAGLIKFDFLGLKTLTVIDKALRYINEGGAGFSISDITLDDRETYDFLSTGRTTGVFQLESDGMKDILVRLSPSRFEELIAIVALYRPGPLKSGMIDIFIKNKKSGKEIKYELKELKNILDETYGVIVYQEQVMSIANMVSGFSMGEADVLRKAMGKKLPEMMAQQQELFIKGAVKNGVSEKKAAKLFENIAKFAEYGFNKSHSAAYAYLTYQTAYLKAHYPVHFMAAVLSTDMDNSDKIVRSIKECRNMQIPILPPDINVSGSEFGVDGKSIRFGLAAVKGVGVQAIESILAARHKERFLSLEEFHARVDGKRVNKKVIESLIKAGAFDMLYEMDGSTEALCRIRKTALDRLNSQGSFAPSLDLFGGTEQDEQQECGPFDILSAEKESLGFYISGNPLDRYQKAMDIKCISGVSALKGIEDRKEAGAAGIITMVRKTKTKEGEPMAYLTVEDGEGAVDCVLFPDLYKRSSGFLDKDTPVFVKGLVESSENGTKIVLNYIAPLASYLSESNGARAVLSIPPGGVDLKALNNILRIKAGTLPLYLCLRTNGAEALIRASYGIEPDDELITKVESVCGKGALRVL